MTPTSIHAAAAPAATTATTAASAASAASAATEMMTPLLRQIRAEFLEMPGLQLTLRQAARLWHLDAGTCDAAMRALVEDGFLREGRHGAFQRADG